MTKTFLLPKGLHVELIGKGGSVVKGLQAEHKVNIQIPSSHDSSSCEIIVSGDEPHVDAALAAIEKILGFKVGNEPLTRISLNVPAGKYGALIGSKGSVLHELQSSTGCHVKIPRDSSDGSYVVVEGTEAHVRAAKAKIEAILRFEVEVMGAEQRVIEETHEPTIDLTAQKEIVEALFFPEDNGREEHFNRFLAYLRSAKKTLEICVFTLTDDRIKHLLLKHAAHGIQIRIITDNDTSVAQGSDIEDYRRAGIPVKMDSTSAHMHHKFAVVDGTVLINGSFNWTFGAASQNYENIMVVNFSSLVRQYSLEFEKLWNKFS